MSKTQSEADEFVTPAYIARKIGVGTASVHRWADEGKIPMHRTPGGHRRFRRTDADEFVRSLMAEATS